MNKLEEKYLDQWNAHLKHFVKQNSDKIIWEDFVYDKTFSFDFIDLIPTGDETDDIWCILSERNDLTLDVLRKNIDKPWNWSSVSYTCPLTSDFVNEHPELPFNYFYLSTSSLIPFSHIINNYEKNWNWQDVCKRFKLSDDEIIRNLDKPWIIMYINGTTIGENMSEHVLRIVHSDLRFRDQIDWIAITLHADINIIMKTTDLPWNYTSILGFNRTPLKFINDRYDLFSDYRKNSVMKNVTLRVMEKAKNKAKDKAKDKKCVFDILLKKLRKYPKIEWKWKFIASKITTHDFFIASDFTSGWRITSMIRHGATTLEHLRRNFPFEFRSLCNTNEKIRKMYNEKCIDPQLDITKTDIRKLFTKDLAVDIRKSFIIDLIMKDGLVEFKRKINEVNQEFNEKFCDPDNIEKIKELKCFYSF